MRVENIQGTPPFNTAQKWQEFRDRLDKMRGVHFKLTPKGNYYRAEYSDLANDEALKAFQETTYWSIEQVKRQQMPKTVISVMRLPELNQMSGDGTRGLVIGASVTLTDIVENEIIKRDYPVIASAARTISTPILRNMGTIGGNLLLDTRCNYYDQNYEWRKAINFCLKKDGDVCWVAPGSSKCWAVQSSDLVPVMVAIGAKFRLISTLGDRMVDAAAFYNDDGIDYLKKRPDELLADIHLHCH